MASTSRKDWLKMLPGVAISLIALVAIFYFVDFGKLYEEIRNANYAILALAAGSTLLWIFVRGMVWRGLLGDLPRYSDVFFAINEGYLLNNLLPFRLGEVGRAFLLGRKPLPTSAKQRMGFTAESNPQPTDGPAATLGFWRTLSSIVVERILDMACGVSILLIALPFVINVPWGAAAARTTGVIVLLGLLILYAMGRFPQTVMAIFQSLTGRIAFANRLGSRLLPRLLDGLAVFQDWKRFLRVVAWMAFNWLVGLLSYWLYIRAFIPEVPLLWAAFVIGAVAVGGTIPSSPGNVGVLEGVIIAALSVFGVNPAISLACGITLHLVQVLYTTILGIYGLSREGETLFGVYQQLRNRSVPT